MSGQGLSSSRSFPETQVSFAPGAFSFPIKEFLHFPVTQDPSYYYVIKKVIYLLVPFLLLHSAWRSIGSMS